jgi:hypothetical protein
MSTLMHRGVVTPSWQAGLLSILPRIQTHAQIKFRRLPAAQREEAITETIAAACQSYQLLAAQGRLHRAYPSTLAGYAVRHVNNGRHVGGHQDTAKDALSPVAQARHEVKVISYDTKQGIGRPQGWRQVAIESRRVSIPDLAAFRLDFADWLGTLTRRDRRIIGALVAGERTSEVAGRFKVSPGRISQLRRQYEREWQIFQGEIGLGTAA